MIADVLADDPSAASDSEAWDRLAEFIERDPDIPGAFRFRHALIRDAAYEGLSYRRRRELHGRVGEVVERRYGEQAEEQAEILSLHFLRAGRAVEGWRYSVAAGRRAQSKWANVEAAEFYRRALDVASKVPGLSSDERASVWEALGDCLQLNGEFEDAARRVRGRAAPSAQGDAGTRRAHPQGGRPARGDGEVLGGSRWYGRGLKAAEALGDANVRGHHATAFKLAVAQVRFRQGAAQECLRLGKEVVEDARAADDIENLAPAYLLLHGVYAMLGSPERAEYHGLALPLYEELGDLSGQASALNNLGVEAYWEGEWDEAIELYERARALRERLGDVTRVALAMNNLGELRSDQGRFEEAEQLLHEARAHLRRGGPTTHRNRGSCKPGPSRGPRGTPRRGKGLAARGARGLRRDARGELGARDGDEARRGGRPARRSCRGSAGSGEHSPR